MQKLIPILLTVALVACGGFFVAHLLSHRRPAEAGLFIAQADSLIEGLQAYRKFTGSFPSGSALDIANELSGKSAKKVLVLATKETSLNAKGEIADPWGTPLQFFFTPSSALVRSAGPNRTFEDSGAPSSDDLVRTDAR